MILEAAIINLTRNLDILSQKDSKSISSHDNLKEKALNCLLNLLQNAPETEYKSLLAAKDSEILLGYSMNILCRLAKSDQAKSIRLASLTTLLMLVERLDSCHAIFREMCSIRACINALPGVASALFGLLMGDTRLPKNLLVTGVKLLTKFVTIAFTHCDHPSEPTTTQEDLDRTCENLSIRLSFLINYVTNNSAQLPQEMLDEMLNLCNAIVSNTTDTLIAKTLNSIVKYTAFLSSSPDLMKHPTLQMRLILIVDNIRDKVQKCDNHCDKLETVVISSLCNLLDNLDNHHTSMLPGEKQSELSVLNGLLRLLPPDSLTVYLEIVEKRSQLLQLLTQLTEFSAQQPFLLLTDTQIDPNALETCDERIYTLQKRFKHLSEPEAALISSTCGLIGANLDWPLLSSILREDLRRNVSPEDLYVSHLLLEGCLQRTFAGQNVLRFTLQTVDYLTDQIQEKHMDLSRSPDQSKSFFSKTILEVVISIETIVTLVSLHLQVAKNDREAIVVLRYLLCPLLSWAASGNRAISEASLSALSRISKLCGKDSTKSLIEANVDYVVDGVVQMLDTFDHNSQVAEVLAITFKLSSLDSFYYFRDVYERIFRILGACYHTKKSKSIALLFHRTLTTLNEWKKAREGANASVRGDPLGNESGIREVINGLDIDRRIERLRNATKEAERVRQRIEAIELEGMQTGEQVIDDIKSGKGAAEMAKNAAEVGREDQAMDENGLEEEEGKKKAPDVVLAEKILTHCVGLISSNFSETKILALKAAASGFELLQDDEDTLLPLVHQIWQPLVSRLTGDYGQNLEVNLCAFECLVSMAVSSKDFIKRRTLDSIIPRICLFLESQWRLSLGERDYGPYCMTMAYKCQLRILTHLGALAYHIQLAYSSLWSVARTTLIYLHPKQVSALRNAAEASLRYLMALDADCVWYFAKQSGRLSDLPFELIYQHPEQPVWAGN